MNEVCFLITATSFGIKHEGFTLKLVAVTTNYFTKKLTYLLNKISQIRTRAKHFARIGILYHLKINKSIIFFFKYTIKLSIRFYRSIPNFIHFKPRLSKLSKISRKMCICT